jgi:hypothetical protein
MHGETIKILAEVKIVISNKNDTKIDYRIVIEVFKYQNSVSFYCVTISYPVRV